MNFWFYAFWYLLIGAVLDTNMSRKPEVWSMLVWPLILIGVMILYIYEWFAKEEPRRYE